VCDIREQEEEPYFNPEFRGGFLVVFLWRRLSLSPVAASGEPGLAWDYTQNCTKHVAASGGRLVIKNFHPKVFTSPLNTCMKH